MVVEYDVDGGIAYVTINRPEVKNALNRDVFDRLDEIWEQFSEDPEAEVAIVKGAGGNFSAGFDLGEEIAALSDLNNEEVRRRMHESIGGLARGKRVYKPIIAAVNGWALAGGFEFALACDLRVAGRDAKFGFPSIRSGLPLADGGSIRLPLIAGLGTYMELALTGKFVGAERARELGFVNRVAPADKTVEYAEKYAKLIMQHPQSGIRGTKEVIYNTVAGGNLEDVLRREGELAYSYHDTDAWETLPEAFAEGERDDKAQRLESLDEAFEKLSDSN